LFSHYQEQEKPSRNHTGEVEEMSIYGNVRHNFRGARVDGQNNSMSEQLLSEEGQFAKGKDKTEKSIEAPFSFFGPTWKY